MPGTGRKKTLRQIFFCRLHSRRIPNAILSFVGVREGGNKSLWSNATYIRNKNMKKFCFLLLMTAFFPLAAHPEMLMEPVSPRSVKLEKRFIPMMTNGKVNFQLYLPPRSLKHIRQGAEKFAQYLSEITGTGIVPVSSLPADKNVTVLRYGDTAFARKLDIDLAKIDPDGFVIAASGNHILLAGCDALPGPRTISSQSEGTRHAGQDFLERFADVRFYFPGKYGTLLPRKKNWSVPAMTVYDRPDNQFRRIYWNGKSQWFDPAIKRDPALYNHYRELRLSAREIPNCHGLAHYGYVRRFAKTHPEYFATKLGGGRADGSVIRVPSDKNGHLCFSSGIMEEIYQDAKAILAGPEAVRKRNMKGSKWWMTDTKPFFNMMPNDSMVRCRCEKCAPYHDGLKIASGHSEKAADFTWKKMLYIANRLKKENIPGIVTMMAYDLCTDVPKQKIPDNVILQVATFGPWGELRPRTQQKHKALIEKWYKTLGFRVYLWNYATKATIRNVPYVPHVTPKAIGRYYKTVEKYIFGAYLESGTDYWFFIHLNNYVFAKVMWDRKADVTAIIDEYCKRMFGPGAPLVKEILDTLERHWLKDVVNNVVETSEGPVIRPPSEYKIWNGIYSPKEIRRINGLFDRAEKLASKNKEALARLKYFRKHLWGPANEASATYFKNAAAIEHWHADVRTLKQGEKINIDGKGTEKAWADAPAVALLPLGQDEAEVLTFVKMLHDKENLYFLFDCREPLTAKMLRTKRPFDDPGMWRDNSVEIHMDPAGTRKENYQLMIDSYGSIADLHITNKPLKHDMKWNSGAEVGTSVVPGKGWFAEVRIPLRSMPAVKDGKIVANFNRHRILDGIKVHPFYVWSPYAGTFGDQANFGHIRLGVRPVENLLTDGDLIHGGIKWTKHNKWSYSGPIPQRDTKIFRTAGVALRLAGHRSGLAHRISGLKPDTAYRLSFFIRQKDVKLNKGARPGGSGFYVRVDDGNNVVRIFPANSFFGTIPWTRWEFNYRTSKKPLGTSYKPYIHLILRNCSGQAWVDKVELVEIPGNMKK